MTDITRRVCPTRISATNATTWRQRKRRGSAHRVEKIGVWMCGAAHERRDELGRRRAECHPVSGEAAANEDARRDASDVRKRVVGKAHRPGPAVRDRGADRMRAQERVELALDHVGGALLLTDLGVDRAVPPAADQYAA